jgi:hypothetical protein
MWNCTSKPMCVFLLWYLPNANAYGEARRPIRCCKPEFNVSDSFLCFCVYEQTLFTCISNSVFLNGDGSVGIKPRRRTTEESRFGSRLLQKAFRSALEPDQRVPCGFFPEVQRPERETYHNLRPVPRLRMGGASPSLPRRRLWRQHGKFYLFGF